MFYGPSAVLEEGGRVEGAGVEWLGMAGRVDLRVGVCLHSTHVCLDQYCVLGSIGEGVSARERVQTPRFC